MSVKKIICKQYQLILHSLECKQIKYKCDKDNHMQAIAINVLSLERKKSVNKNNMQAISIDFAFTRTLISKNKKYLMQAIPIDFAFTRTSTHKYKSFTKIILCKQA